ncbi:hypothetical protein V5799_007293 [Amblyomma americanum]|uniref:Uncharacterized protein n=1 Tax=Amblyomma americanum TaxID=6943 RepID=A0AAQ4DTY5_AMBAM
MFRLKTVLTTVTADGFPGSLLHDSPSPVSPRAQEGIRQPLALLATSSVQVPAALRVHPGQSLLNPKTAAPALGLCQQFELAVPAALRVPPGQSLLKPKIAAPALNLSQKFELAAADCDALKDEVTALKRKLSLSQRKVSSLEKENKNLRQGISDVLNGDQVTCLQKNYYARFILEL